MACEKRPYLCGILLLGTLALFFHLVGFVAPGWIVLRRSVMEDESIFEMKGQLIDHGGVTVPPDEEPMFRKRRSHSGSEDSNSEHHHPGHHHGGGHPHGHHGSHHGSHPEPHPGPKPTGTPGDMDDIREEKHSVEAWMMEMTSEIETFDVRTSYGLWYSTICVHMRRNGMKGDDDDSDEKHMDDESSSSSSEDGDGRKRHCRCKKISTKCALQYAMMYETNFFFKSKSGGYLSYKNFGYASLTEHRVENCLVLAFLVLGLIAAIAGFRKVNGCRCAGIVCVVFMLLAAFIAVVPVARLSHYSVMKRDHNSPIKVHAPYSVIATGLGALMSLITALVAGFAVMKKYRDGEPRGWYQFNNELEGPNEKKEKPGVYLTADTLPVKPGLYDVCDFSNIKPVEEIKKPEAEEGEPDQFVL